MYYNKKIIEIPSNYINNIDILFEEENLNKFLNDSDLTIFEKFLPKNIVNYKI